VVILKSKMWRDIGENKTAYVACAVVIVIGLMTYTSMQMARDNLAVAREEFYRQYHYADGFAKIRAMPYSRVEKLEEIEGIDQIQGRLVHDVRVLMPQKEKNVYLRLISLDMGKSDSLNGVKLSRGSFSGEGEKAIVLADKFFDANRLSLGDTLTVIIEGKKVELKIAGTGQSPEYIYAMKDVQTIFPDPQAFEVAYMPYDVMEGLFNQKGTVNDISFTLKPGYGFDDVKERLETELEKYGLESLIPARDQMSNAILTQELKQLEKTSRSVPLLFLLISAIILYIMLKRLVESQRGQIGTLMAFGYRKGEIIFHYLSYGLIVGAAGGVMGGILGTALSASMTKMYQEFFSLPGLAGRFSVKYFLSGILLSVGFSLIGAFEGAKGILRLKPVDAMRPPVPVFNRSRYEINTYLLAEDVLHVREGMKVTLIQKRKDGDYRFYGIVKSIAPSAVEKVSALGLIERRVKVTVQPGGNMPELRPGYSVDVEFRVLEQKDKLAVPKTCLFPYEGGDALWVVRDGRARVQKVTKGMETQELVVIEQGLKPGDKVIKNPRLEGLKEGKKVRG
jgi:putative ABC transport system permease protein